MKAKRATWYVALAIAVANSAIAQTTLKFDFTPGPDGKLGTEDDVPIDNNTETGGELVGDEFEPVGIVFSTPGIHLNIGCAIGPGNPNNCLGADEFSDNDFSGLLIGEFTLGGGRATVDLITIDMVNASLTNLYDIDGRLIGTFGPDFTYDGPTPVARFESILDSDAHRTLTYDGLAAFDPCDPCDANCDGSIDLTDVEPFIALLFGGDPCNYCTGDTNDDGSIDLTDVEAFIGCLLG